MIKYSTHSHSRLHRYVHQYSQTALEIKNLLKKLRTIYMHIFGGVSKLYREEIKSEFKLKNSLIAVV